MSVAGPAEGRRPQTWADWISASHSRSAAARRAEPPSRGEFGGRSQRIARRRRRRG